jgi:hypothetical protein
MAEKIVSPGVFTRENDLSFLQQGVAAIGAAFIGPFKEGPLVPTIVNSQAEFETLFGKVDDTYYTPLAVQNYLREAGTATICRVAGIGGYTEQNPILVTLTTGSVSASVAILFNTDNDATGFTGTTSTSIASAVLTLSGSELGFSGSISLDTTSVNNIESTFGTSPYGSKGAYVYANFKNSGVTIGTNTTASITVLDDQDFGFDAQEATTPLIQSQLISNARYDLFNVQTIGAGNAANTKVKIAITNVKAAGTVSGTDYGTFTLLVRDYADTDKKKIVLETYSNLNLDPNSANYIARVIGNRKRTIASNGKVTETGDWVNNSKYIRIVLPAVAAPVQAVPFGHAAYLSPISASAAVTSLIPAVKYQVSTTAYMGGIALDTNSGSATYTVSDNNIYTSPIPNGAGVGANVAFGLDATNGGSLTLTSTAAADIAVRQFIVAFQGGFDGQSPTIPIYKGIDILPGNTQGLNCTTSTSSGSVAYGKHISALSNADEYDINLIAAPGITRADHSSVFTSILDMVEQRSDAFFIADGGNATTSLAATVTQAQSVDSNYAAFYYPWIKTVDINTNKLITIPPSVLLPGVFAANDRVAAEWFAPAGLNRGGLVGAVSVLDRLTQSDRDTLYEGKVNPIAQFPGQGIVVFGQKTLQDKPSALDRINVRRLLLTVRKYIASTSRYLVFEQNSATTRNRFLNIANPYLEAIQQRQGLYAFKVVMDETNNTADVIDRNILKGAIYLQPTKTAEFIQIDFNILPTGASFGG